MSSPTPEAPKGEPEGKSAEQAKPTDKKQAADPESDLGDAGLKALQSEREARKALEKQLAQFKDEQKAQTAKLAEAFGLTNQQASQGDVVAQLQARVDQMHRDNIAYQLAVSNGITDAADLEIIRAAGDEATMQRLAARLAPSAAPEPVGPALPKPDLSQGAQGKSVATPQEEFASFLNSSLTR